MKPQKLRLLRLRCWLPSGSLGLLELNKWSIITTDSQKGPLFHSCHIMSLLFMHGTVYSPILFAIIHCIFDVTLPITHWPALTWRNGYCLAYSRILTTTSDVRISLEHEYIHAFRNGNVILCFWHNKYIFALKVDAWKSILLLCEAPNWKLMWCPCCCIMQNNIQSMVGFLLTGRKFMCNRILFTCYSPDICHSRPRCHII